MTPREFKELRMKQFGAQCQEINESLAKGDTVYFVENILLPEIKAHYNALGWDVAPWMDQAGASVTRLHFVPRPSSLSTYRRIYVASSWRNAHQQDVVALLRAQGHDIYDFRNPAGGSGFRWTEIDPDWLNWTPQQYREALNHPIAIQGHKSDLDAITWADTCVLVLPSGRSASYEFGWCVGQGKRGIVYMPEACEPELMYRPAPITTNVEELLAEVSR